MSSVIKKRIKSVINSYPVYNAKELIKKIEPYKIISFDVFDTLINRNVFDPKDIFTIVGQSLFQNTEKARKFRNDRIRAEEIARQKDDIKEDIGIAAIYDFLKEKYPDTYKKLMEKEISIETEVAYANPVIKQVYDWCLEHKRQIVLISDMYLSKEVLEDILSKNDYQGYCALYVSSDIGLTKASGNLFKHVLSELNINAGEIVHIGDSIKGDYLGAKKNSIKAIHISTNPSRTKFLRGFKKDVFWKKVDRAFSGYLTGTESDYYRYGFEVLAPLLYGFSVWLQNKASERNIKKLYFLARDGYLLQKAFEIVYENSTINSKYLYVSRRALRIPIFYTCKDLKEFISFIPKNKYLSRKEIFDLLGLDDSNITTWQEAGFTDTDLVFTNALLDNRNFNRFYQLIEHESKERARGSFTVFIDYLKENGFNGKVGIVDIGWAGTIQRCMNRLIDAMEEDVEVNGFYVGLTKEAESDLNGIGFISSKYMPQVATAGLFEYPFLAHEGSLKKMTRINGKIEPCVGVYEYENDKENFNYINEMQNGALEGVKVLKNYLSLDDSYPLDVYYKALYRLTKLPTLKEANCFGEMMFYDGSSYPLAKPGALVWYVTNPKKFIKDFSDSGWKVGFLKRLFKISFPYARMLEKAKNS
ncbi:MAG: HAD-IA family hydrolase [Lachnospiraceae bacterium]|nr:HAD-IA family hydrolase [Lachnospiraceae bacterium]